MRLSPSTTAGTDMRKPDGGSPDNATSDQRNSMRTAEGEEND
jgi:hypothetical protein